MAEKACNLNRTYRFTPCYTKHYLGPFLKRIYFSKPLVTGLWLLFVQYNLLCGPWVCVLQARSPTMQDSKVLMSVSHAKVSGRPLCSHTGPIVCFMMWPGRQRHVPAAPPQNCPPSPSKTEDSRRVGGWESSSDLSLQPYLDLCWRLHGRSENTVLCRNILFYFYNFMCYEVILQGIYYVFFPILCKRPSSTE